MAKLKLNLVTPIPDGIDSDRLHQAVAAIKEPGAGTISVKFVTDAAIKRLNREYAGKAEATDVLAFDYTESQTPGSELGDIVISIDTARRQAEAAGLDLTEEAVILTLHGVLHILGLDHQTAADRAKMDAVQAKYAAQANIKYRDFKWV